MPEALRWNAPKSKLTNLDAAQTAVLGQLSLEEVRKAIARS
jgi:hypothetical protein